MRISKSAIVNIDAIDRIEPGFGGALSGDSTVVELQPGPRNAVVGTRGRSIVVVPVADVYIAHMDGGQVQLIPAKGELRSNYRLYELESTLG